MHNSDTTIGENVRYFMYKYTMFIMIGLMIFLIIIYKKIDNEIQRITQLDDICLAGAIRDVCEERDSGVVQFVDRNQMCNMIDTLCTR